MSICGSGEQETWGERVLGPVEDVRNENSQEHYQGADVISMPSNKNEVYLHVSPRRSQVEVFASSRPERLIAQNRELESLCRAALTGMDERHFIENFRRLLKHYYLDLSRLARTDFEQATVYLLRSRPSRIRIAQLIVDRLKPESEQFRTQLQQRNVNTEESGLSGRNGWSVTRSLRRRTRCSYQR